MAMDGAQLLSAEVRGEERLAVSEQPAGVTVGGARRRGSAYTVALERGEIKSWMRFVHSYTGFLQRFKVAVLILWLILAAAGAYFTPSFLGNTTNEFDPPPGSPSDLAEQLQFELFCPCDPCPCPDPWGPDDGPGGHHHHHQQQRRRRLGTQVHGVQRRLQSPHHDHNHSHGGGGNHSNGGGDYFGLTLVVHNASGGTVTGEDGKATVFNQFLQAMNRSFEAENGPGSVGAMQTFDNSGPQMRSQYLSKDQTAALVMFNINFDHMRWHGNGNDNDARRRLERAILDAAESAQDLQVSSGRRRLHGGPDIDPAIQDAEDDFRGSSLRAYSVGMNAFGNDAINGVQHDLLRMDSVSFPLAFCVMAAVLRSVRLLIAPFLCIVASVAISFGVVMYPISLSVDIITFAPAVMMSITLAVSIDYSLFILSRYREEIIQGLEVGAAVEQALGTAGHTVLVSGTTLAVAFAGLGFFPTTLLSSVGVGAACAVAVTVLVNLSLTPALLLLCPGFFGNVKESCICCQPSFCPGATVVGESTKEALSRSCWHKVSTRTRSCKALIFLIAGLCVIPFIMLAPELSVSIQFDYLSPRNAGSTVGYHILVQKFGAGVAFPNTLMVVCPRSQHMPPGCDGSGYHDGCTPVEGPVTSCIYTQDFFEKAGAVVENLAKLQPHADFLGVLYNPEIGRVLWPEFKAAVMEKDSPLCQGAERGMCDQLRGLARNYINQNGSAMTFDVKLSVDPFSEQGIAWAQAVQAAFPSTQCPGCPVTTYYLLDGSQDMYDVQNTVYQLLPVAMVVTMVIVFAIVGIAFRSLVVPLRAVLTIVFTLVIVFGAAVLVYQHGVLDNLGIPCLHTIADSQIAWLIPVMSFSTLTGLALDYDVFIISRIAEYRDLGYDDHSAITLGLSKTGWIISAAGLVMAIAFGGLFLADEPAMNQLAFFFVTSVLVDTFITRTILVPCIMDVLGASNWLPRPVPTPRKTITAEGDERELQVPAKDGIQ